MIRGKTSWFPLAASAMALVVLMSLLVMPAAMADGVTIDPATNELSLEDGEVFEETITVTIPPGPAATKADVYLLADTTGSMGGPIGAVKSAAATVVADIQTALPGVDVQFGVGNYKDFPHDPYAFQHQVSITDDESQVTGGSGIGAWGASGGADGSEGQFYALDRIANDPGAIGWRADAEKILVWFGDCPAHDPVPTAASGLPYDITEGTVTSDLVDAGITVLAISTNTGCPNSLDGDPVAFGGNYAAAYGITEGGSAGQATRMASATGGEHISGVTAATIVSEIVDLVTSAVSSINSLSLVATGDTAAYVTSITPASYGPLDGSESHTLEFEVVFTGKCSDEAHTLTGTLDVVADGGVVAQKSVTMHIPSCNEPPSCEAAAPSVSEIWPPNHKFVPVSILGVTDPDGDTVTITVDSIFQDEPVKGPSSGNFAPDGKGVGTDTAEVRAERNGDPKTPGNGRVYHISFTADDGNGGTCSGAVQVGVPHDQGNGKPAVDEGPLHDSTVS